MTYLTMSVQRADEPSKEEDLDVMIDEQIYYVRSHLEFLSLKQYKGGSVENIITSRVPLHAAVPQTLKA